MLVNEEGDETREEVNVRRDSFWPLLRERYGCRAQPHVVSMLAALR